ncbi:hypothetical protein EDD76_107244 [Kineothrix alysoides]|uniref:CDP-glycerol:poly(Glycerophosphate) glycerophosphotransferase n=1 Tax=Kineothrix alysoides TaxID=1469948 RepID=A0A4R1QYT5_9FIRM|nr:hypothetical protein [Kineothrix alysoides]TCL58128.1 hypothetical protein EDD76_107244 [Kineothrix alysoides]
MKRYKKKEMLESVKTLEKANDIIGRNSKEDQSNLLDVLTQCQESAILLGTYIDSLGAKYSHLVKILEDYCENIYQMSTLLSDDYQCRELSKEIQKQLTQLNNGIRYDLPEYRKEVVFLPYKASMWDSLESIWKASDEDEDCDAYVIPIPYFDKNQDGSFGEIHYEGDQYPDYVPITNYEQYDFEERKPDMIFIHNPYDGGNYVTSVHPFFYSKNLKQYTDMLVYIPYFILDEIKPENKSEIEGMKHFCMTSGVFNADKVIVQSENMRQIYIDVLTEATKNTKEARKYWEEKILGLGSPKVDKVMSTKKDDLIIPEEWIKIIQKPDGRWKKIIFYNTSIEALLQSGRRMLRKMESVLAAFKENKDEVALLWRPHPLIENTLASMRPQLWNEYKIIRDKYISEAWGIYDNTADLDRAIAVGDAYYGDASSLVQLCRKVGKPVMLQNVTVDNEKDNSAVLIAEDCIQIDRKLLFVARDINIIFSLDMDNGKINLIDSIPEEDFIANRLSAKIVRWEQQLLFVPFNAKKIWIYRQDIKEWKSLVLMPVNNEDISLKMFQAIAYQDKVFLIGSNYPAIVCVDMEKETLTYFDRIYDCLKDKRKELEDCYVRCDCVQINDCFYMASALDNKVLKFDMSNCQYFWIEVGSDRNRYSGIAWDGSNFWLAPRQNTAIVKWDGTNKVTEYLLPQEFAAQCMHFLGVVYDGTKIIMPGGIDGSKTIKFKNGCADKFEILSEQYSFYKRINDGYIVSQTTEGELTVLDRDGRGLDYLCAVDIEALDSYKREQKVDIIDIIQKKLCIENHIISMHDLCSTVDVKGKEKQINEICGGKIWREMA